MMASSINGSWSIARAANYMGNHTNRISSNVVRLAGNTKFATGADNPAGRSFAQRTRNMANSVTQAAENLQNGQTMFKIADAAYSSILDSLTKAREIASQATDPNYTTADTDAANSSISTLYAQAKEIATSATFNGNSVLNTAFTLEAGGDTSNTISTTTSTLPSFDENAPQVVAADDTATPPVEAVTASTVVSKIDEHINAVMKNQAAAGAWEASLGYVADFVNNKGALMQDAADNAGNVNIATETAAYVRNQIALQSAQYIAAQQNQNAYSVLNLLK